MNSSKVVTEYPVMSKGILEWEIQNVDLDFSTTCEECCDSEYCCDRVYCWIHYRNLSECLEPLTSASKLLAAGGGNQSEWHFNLVPNSECVQIDLFFDGLFQSNGSQMNEPLTFGYNAIVEKTFKRKTKIMGFFSGKESSKKTSVRIQEISNKDLGATWDVGSLKITVEISHFSDSVNNTVKDVGELAMDASVCEANAGAQKTFKDFCVKNHVKLMKNPEYKKLFLANPQSLSGSSFPPVL